MEGFFGSTEQTAKFCADTVRRVLELSLDKGHDDPRHESHWWQWQDWPIDGRQWDYDGTIDRHSIDKKWISEHERRKQQDGFRGSGLQIERQLEGAIWRDKLYPQGRTSLRSSAVFSKRLFPDPDNVLQDDDNEDEHDDDPSPWWIHLHIQAGVLKDRCEYDASICQPHKVLCRDQDLRGKASSEELQAAFFRANPFSPLQGLELGEDVAYAMITSFSFFICTDSFACKAEQQEANDPGGYGVPSFSISAMLSAVDSASGKRIHYTVVAEAPAPTLVVGTEMEHGNRIAGFVFRDARTKLEQNTQDDNYNTADDDDDTDCVRITYVESSHNDLQTLNDAAKDAFLEDRALVVHRLVKHSVAWDETNTSKFIQRAPTLRGGRPSVNSGLPPSRTLETMMTVHRADPRWPFQIPNSVCLECGAAPTPDNKLLACSKCQARRFCSKECLAKSWKGDIWSHSTECKRAQAHNASMFGTSMREALQGAAELQGCDASRIAAAMAIFEKHQGPASDMDMKANSVEEMQAQRDETARLNRKAAKKKNGKNGKGKKKKKK